MRQYQQEIAAALESLQLGNPERLEMLLAYGDSLRTHAHIIGLIGDSKPERILQRHILENLAPIPQIDKKLCLDMGTGAGLPGMVLALAMPDTQWLLLDSRKRCAEFLQKQIDLLKPGNVSIVESRAEKYQPENKPDLIISRAFAELAPYYRMAAPLISDNGRILAIKGRNLDQEKAKLASLGASCRDLELPVPNAENTVLLVELAADPTSTV